MEALPIHLKMKMSDVVHRNYMLIPVLERFGIYLGFEDKTVQTVCEEIGLDAQFMVELLNAFTKSDYVPSSYVRQIDVLLLLTYLKDTHYNYLHNWVLSIEKMIENLRELGEDGGYIDLVLNFFKEYCNELSLHISREEQIVFPYIEALNEVLKGEASAEEKQKLLDSYSMKVFETEHDDIVMKLKDLKNILIKYMVSPKRTLQYYAIIQELFKLEEDVEYHTRVEDKILIPRVVFMEKELAKKIQ